MIQPETPVASAASRWLWLGPMLYMLVVGAYFVGRYAGLWAEADSTTFTNVIRPIVEQGRLLSEEAGGAIYPNGYAYQGISAILIGLTGIDVVVMQQHVYPLLAALVVLPAWVAYRELTGGARAATLSTMLLFTQPEFLFVVLRSSHEKFTRTAMLLCLFLLVRSFKLRGHPGSLAIHIGLLYILLFTLITSNNLLAHSFIFAAATALFLGQALQGSFQHLPGQRSYILQRLSYMLLIGMGLVYLFTFFIYPPALHNLAVLQSVAERIAALFLDVQATGGEGTTNSYAQVAGGWLSLPIYFLVSLANWVVLAASFLIWINQGVRWLVHRQAPEREEQWLLWLLYAAFAVQGGLSALADASGALSTNLQHRLFPSFSLVAVALLGTALAGWRPRRFSRPIQLGLAMSLGLFAVLSVFKATNEPLFSNKWTFYRPEEMLALEWSDAHYRAGEVWTEFDERLAVAYANTHGSSANNNAFSGYLTPTTRSFLVSPVTRLRSKRLVRSLPMPPDALRVYDNGDAELYRLRPETPYQK